MDAETKQYFDDQLTNFGRYILHEVFGEIDGRLKLQAGLIQSGARAMARFSEFSESSEARHVNLAERFEGLERRE